MPAGNEQNNEFQIFFLSSFTMRNIGNFIDVSIIDIFMKSYFIKYIIDPKNDNSGFLQ